MSETQTILPDTEMLKLLYVCSCERAIFAEWLPGVVAHYARSTERLDGLFTHVSFALGGEAGARLLRELGVVVP